MAAEAGDLLGSLAMLNQVARIAFVAIGQIDKPTMSDLNELRTSVAYAIQQKQQILRRLAQLAKTAPDDDAADPWAAVDAALAADAHQQRAQPAPKATGPRSRSCCGKRNGRDAKR